MSLDDASKKMSKSNPNPGSYIAMLDKPDVIRKKIRRATTDSGREVKYDPAEQTGNQQSDEHLCALFRDESWKRSKRHYEGKGYGDFKKDLGGTCGEHTEADPGTLQGDPQFRGTGRAFCVKGPKKRESEAENTFDRSEKEDGICHSVFFVSVF